jgi:hypothetical protein
MSKSFAAAFSYKDKHGYCLDYENIPQLRSANLPAGLQKVLDTLSQISAKASITSLSTGLDGRYWIRYTEDGENYHNGMFS